MYLTTEGRTEATERHGTIYSTKLFNPTAKPIRTFGDPDKQRPEKWNSAVFLLLIRTSGISLGTLKKKNTALSEIGGLWWGNGGKETTGET